MGVTGDRITTVGDLAEQGKGYMILFQLDEADLRRALTHPHVMIGSDGSSLAADGPLATGKPHPRSYGTFPRVLGRYARDERVLSLESAVWKMTGLPARRLGLSDRGMLTAGAKADVVVFDAATVADRATYEDPHRYATDIGHVLVNGCVVIADGEPTGALPGAGAAAGVDGPAPDPHPPGAREKKSPAPRYSSRGRGRACSRADLCASPAADSSRRA